MVVQTADEGISNADADKSCERGMCLATVEDWLEGPHGCPDAITAWNWSDHQHPNDRNPPRGAPVYYRGGSHGHIALSRGGGQIQIRSTDCEVTYDISNVDLDWPEWQWGYPYIGWTEDINGPLLPYLQEKPPEPEGLLGMTHTIGQRRSADWNIPGQTDGWDKALPINDDGDSTVVGDSEAGDGLIMVTACATVTGLKDGEAFDMAWAIVDCRASDGGDAKWPGGWVNRRDPRRAVAGEAGYRTVEATFCGTLGKPSSGRSKRLRLVYQTPSKTAKLGSLTVEGGY